MPQTLPPPPFFSELPEVRGRISTHVPLAPLSWFRVGGTADVVFKPADQDDLIHFLKHCPSHIPVTVLGATSNMIIRDGGIRGVVIRLGRGFNTVETNTSDYSIIAGSAVLDSTIAQTSAGAGIAGLEFYIGIPGSLGGALRMNAGCYGSETKDILLWAEAIDRTGNLHRIDNAGMNFSYRHCGIPEDWIFVRAQLQGTTDAPEDILARMNKIKEQREHTQPIRERTGGSTFANPDGNSAWKLVDEAGCRGLKKGGAQVSPLHCNFLLNTGDASAADLEALGEEVRARVLETSSITLNWEIKRIGDKHG